MGQASPSQLATAVWKMSKATCYLCDMASGLLDKERGWNSEAEVKEIVRMMSRVIEDIFRWGEGV